MCIKWDSLNKKADGGRKKRFSDKIMIIILIAN